MKNSNKTYREFLATVAPAAFSMFGTNIEKEITIFKQTVSSLDAPSSQSGYIAQLMSDTCIAEVAADCLHQFGIGAMNKAKVKNSFVAAWIAA